MKETILVTGANGHLGLNTVRSLLKKGYNVKAFVRKTSNLSGLKNLPIQYNYGDVRNQNSLIEASKDCDTIIHHAAVYKTWAKSVKEIMEPAIEGTKNIFAAASNAGIKKLVYTSSTYAIGASSDSKKVLTNKDWNQNENVPYGIAKTKSELLAWELSDKYKIPMISLCPGAIFGRYDYRVTPSNRMILDMIKGIGMTVEGVLSFIDARDAGELHALAIEKGKIGTRYILTNNAIEMKNIGKMVKNLTGKMVPHLPFGRSINIGSAKMMEIAAKLTGWDPAFTVGMAKEYSHRYAQFDNSETLKDFDYKLYTTEETVRDAIKWFCFLKSNKVSKKITAQFQPESDW